MTAAWVNVTLVHMTDAAIKASETVCNQNIEFCNDDNNFDDTDKKYIDSDFCNSINIIAALMKMQDKLQFNTKDKNKKITQEWIKKEKQYFVSQILC